MGEEQGTVSETNRQVLPQFPKSELEMWKILLSFLQLVSCQAMQVETAGTTVYFYTPVRRTVKDVYNYVLWSLEPSGLCRTYQTLPNVL